MSLNLTQFLFSISHSLDVAKSEIISVSNFHSKRVTFISVKIAQELNFSNEEVFDLYSFAMLQDNGLIEAYEREKNLSSESMINEGYIEHCIIGEENLSDFPFLTKNKNVIKYHHEHYDGSGFFGIKGEEIPLMSQIIFLANSIDSKFNLKEPIKVLKDSISEFLEENKNKLFSQKLVDVFLQLINENSFWEDMRFFNSTASPEDLIENFKGDISLNQFFKASKILSRLMTQNQNLLLKTIGH